MPRLIGVVHLPPLPGSPRASREMHAIEAAVREDVAALAEAGFDGVIVENFGDAPFAAGRVDAATVAAMTRCGLAARQAAPSLVQGLNVLRNDALSALAIAAATGAELIRINVHCGARVTDQGLVQGRAHDTLRRRRELGLDTKLLCDVAVKHSAALTERPVAEETEELVLRGLADAVLVTGIGTGHEPSCTLLQQVVAATNAPVFIASGATTANLPTLLAPRGERCAYGVIVGSTLRTSGKAGDPISAELAKRFAEAFRKSASEQRMS